MLNTKAMEAYRESVISTIDLNHALLDVQDKDLADRIRDIVDKKLVCYQYFLIELFWHSKEKENDNIRTKAMEAYRENVISTIDLNHALLDVQDKDLADRIRDIIDKKLVCYQYFLIELFWHSKEKETENDNIRTNEIHNR